MVKMKRRCLQAMSDQTAESTLLIALKGAVESADQAVEKVLEDSSAVPKVEESGTVVSIGNGIARVSGLSGVQAEELVEFPGGVTGIAFNLDPSEVGVIMLGSGENIASGSRVRRTGRVVDVPCRRSLLGRVIDAAANPLDNRGRSVSANVARLSAKRRRLWPGPRLPNRCRLGLKWLMPSSRSAGVSAN
jgi:F0F1-type ATP synthase alpha subunit